MTERTPEHKAKMREGYARWQAKQKADREAGIVAKQKVTKSIVNVAPLPDEPSPSSPFAGAAGPIIAEFRCSCGRPLSLRHQTRPTSFVDFSGAGTRFRFYCAECHYQYNVNVVQQNGVSRPK